MCFNKLQGSLCCKVWLCGKLLCMRCYTGLFDVSFVDALISTISLIVVKICRDFQAKIVVNEVLAKHASN